MQKLKIITIISLYLLIGLTPSYGQDAEDTLASIEPASKDKPPEYLIQTPWLIEHIQDEDLILLDVRSLGEYLDGHIPRAISCNLKDFIPDFVTLPSQKRLQKHIDRCGINEGSMVVIYDKGSGLYSSLMFWLLNYGGHKKVSVLNGGIEKWKEDGQPLEVELNAAIPGSFIPTIKRELLVDTNWILMNINNPTVAILDVRSSSEYTGIISPNKRRGHIPGAINIPWTKNLDQDGKTLRDMEELMDLYELFGITGDKTIIIYGQSLLRATHTFIVLKLLGYKDVRIYKSFKIWTERKDLLIER